MFGMDSESRPWSNSSCIMSWVDIIVSFLVWFMLCMTHGKCDLWVLLRLLIAEIGAYHKA